MVDGKMCTYGLGGKVENIPFGLLKYGSLLSNEELWLYLQEDD